MTTYSGKIANFTIYEFLEVPYRKEGEDMANAADINALMRENLKDAGLEGDRIEMCMDLILKGEYDKLNKMLSEYRENLLKNIHVYTAKLDCLDYFTYTITKNGGTMK